MTFLAVPVLLAAVALLACWVPARRAARVDPVAAAGRIGLYHTASSYAARFCRRVAAVLEGKRSSITRDLLAELRRFYRWGNVRKLRHIERYA